MTSSATDRPSHGPENTAGEQLRYDSDTGCVTTSERRLYSDAVASYVGGKYGHLFAAAPDLYAALKELLADITEYQTINNLGGHDNHSQRMARAALAKAEGRS